ncbi:MAG: hypothetical protein KDJ65_09025 [Anaerolineae bacterium]|nr:hypothetical protein [Anaerolineae bacterium]
MKTHLIFSLVLLLLAIGVAACGNAIASPESQVELKLAPESELPEFVSQAAPQVKEAYRFAIANPEVLSAFPCYCGCNAVGHQNNLQCYIKEVQTDGSIEFENHAFG